MTWCVFVFFAEDSESVQVFRERASDLPDFGANLAKHSSLCALFESDPVRARALYLELKDWFYTSVYSEAKCNAATLRDGFLRLQGDVVTFDFTLPW